MDREESPAGPRWLSTEEAASESGMSAQWVRKRIMEGRLPASSFRFGARATYRILRSDWHAFLRTYRRSAVEDAEERDAG